MIETKMLNHKDVNNPSRLIEGKNSKERGKKEGIIYKEKKKILIKRLITPAEMKNKGR